MAVSSVGWKDPLLQNNGDIGVGGFSDDLDFDSLASPPEEQVESSCTWKRWGGRVISVAAGIGAVALRAFQISRVANVIGSLGAGAAIQSAIQSGYKGMTAARIRQVSLTLLGQATLFAFSQGFANTEDVTWKTYLTHAIIAQLGANIAIAARWLYEKRGALRVITQTPQEIQGNTLQYTQCLSHNKSHVLKVLVAGGCGVGYFIVSDPLLKGVLSLVSTFFPSQVFAERFIDLLDHPRLFKWKTVFITTSYALEPLAFIPWADPTSTERIKQLAFVGIGLGLINGIADQSKIPRFERIPIESLEEFQKLKPPSRPEKLGRTCPSFKYLAYRTFQFAAPLMALGVLGFGIWQEAALTTNDQRVALGSMIGGFVVTYPVFRQLDSGWDPRKASRLKNSIMVSLWGSSRVLGFPLVVVYFAGTNSLKLDGDALSTSQSPFHFTVLTTSLFSYGALFGRELGIMASDRIGSPQLRAPELLYINAATTAYLSLKGAIP
jgi:hypothetical protein